MKSIGTIISILLFLNGAHGQSRFIACDTAFTYRAANYQYGIVDFHGNILVEPQFRTLELVKSNHAYNTAIFSMPDHSFGVVDLKGNILLEGVSNVTDYKVGDSGMLMCFESGYNDVTVCSSYTRKKIGYFENHFCTHISNGGISDRYDRVGVVKRKASTKYCYNQFGDRCDNEKSKYNYKLSSGHYQVGIPSEYRGITSSTANVAAYQAHFPDYHVISEFYDSNGTISLLVTSENKFGLIDKHGEVLLEFEYKFIEFKNSLLKITQGYDVGISDVRGNIIYEPIYNYIIFNDSKPDLFRIGTEKQCEGNGDYYGNLFMPEDCK